MKMGTALGGLGLALVLAFAARNAAAAPQTTLKFGFYPPATSYVNTLGITPWIQRVEKASNGTLAIKLFTGPTLGTEHNMYDRVIADVAQVGYSTLGPLGSPFEKAEVTSLPFLSDNSGLSAVAFWRLYKRGLFGDEFDKVKPLALFNFPTAYLHTEKPIRTLGDVAGLKLMVSSRVEADVMVKLGAAPVTLAPTEFYEGLQRGISDGTAVSWTAVKTFKLDEVTKYHLEVPLGESPVFVFMNKTAYASLPPQAKAAIDENSGEAFSKILGANNEEQGRAEAKHVAAKPGQTIDRLSPAEQARWKARIEPVLEAWAKRVPNGANILAAYREELKQLGMTD